MRAWMPTRARGPHPAPPAKRDADAAPHTHPSTTPARPQGPPAVNSFWVHGTRALPAGLAAPAQPPQVQTPCAPPPCAEDWRARASAWTALDAGPVAELPAGRTGPAVRPTLSGEHSAQSFHTAPLGLVQRIQRFFRPSALWTCASSYENSSRDISPHRLGALEQQACTCLLAACMPHAACKAKTSWTTAWPACCPQRVKTRHEAALTPPPFAGRRHGQRTSASSSWLTTTATAPPPAPWACAACACWAQKRGLPGARPRGRRLRPHHHPSPAA